MYVSQAFLSAFCVTGADSIILAGRRGGGDPPGGADLAVGHHPGHPRPSSRDIRPHPRH